MQTSLRTATPDVKTGSPYLAGRQASWRGAPVLLRGRAAPGPASLRILDPAL